MKKIKSDKFIDCTGLYCPAPIFEVRKAIDSLARGEILELVADDPAAEEDFKAWAKTTGNELLEYFKEKDKIVFYIRKS
jgi:tRNA 2-thiouridine synthesizing protein A